MTLAGQGGVGLDALAQSGPPASVLAWFLASNENREQVAERVGVGIEYAPFWA